MSAAVATASYYLYAAAATNFFGMSENPHHECNKFPRSWDNKGILILTGFMWQ